MFGMFDVLDDAKRLFHDFHVKEWKTLDINYEQPRVERLWVQLGSYRIYLHVIHKCNGGALYHPHPWESAVEILAGSYRMGLGREIYGEPPVTATLVLGAGSQYEMRDPSGWHYVEPITPVVLSIMVTGERFARSIPASTVPKTSLGPLPEGRAEEIYSMFKGLL